MAALQTAQTTETAGINSCIAALQTEFPAELRSRISSATILRGQLRAHRREPRITTTIPELDNLLQGGLPSGAVIELVGRRSCGRLSILLASLCAVTASGKVASLIDLGDQLDPRSAADFGIELDRLLWLRPQKLDDALAAAYILVETGFSLLALDLGLPPLRGRVSAATWVRLRRVAEIHRAVLLVGSPYRVTGCAATTIVSSQRGRGSWAGKTGTPRLLRGLATHLMADKLQGHRPQRTTTVFFTSPDAAFAAPSSTPRLRDTGRESHAI
ncbi:MAG: hypothetical protein GY906_25085 [bacterium]|nr:hypothetical protein [bacterium]